MLRKIVGIFLLLAVVVSFTPTALADSPEIVIDPACTNASNNFVVDLVSFIGKNLLGHAIFLGIDMGTSFLEELSIFGFSVGGIFEPLDQAIDFMRGIWMKALIYGTIASIFNWFAGALIESGIWLNLTLTANNPLITYGGKIILQLVNFGFIISIIFIGIATILRLKKDEFSADRLLIKLIIGVIFANLTIPVALGITTLGTNLTSAMYTAASPCPKAFTQQFTAGALMNRFVVLLDGGMGASGADSIQGAELPENDYDFEELNASDKQKLREQQGKLEESGGAFTGILGFLVVQFLSIIAGAVLSFIAALTFLAFGLFLLIRFVILALLVTFSPAIWLGFIFKGFKLKGKNIWGYWWSQFIQWTFFGPVIVLFLAFATEYLVSITENPIPVPNGGEFIQIAQLLSVIVISSVGLIAAKSFSGVFGNLAMNGVSAGLGFVANKTNKIMQKGKLRATLRADELEAQGKTAQARFARVRAKTYGGGVLNSQGVPSALGAIGLKPRFKSFDEKAAKEEIAHDKMRSVNRVTGIGKLKTSIKNPIKALNLSDNDVKNLPENDKDSFVEAIRALQKLPPNSLNPEQAKALRKHEATLSKEISKKAVKDINSPNVVADARNILSVHISGIKELVENSDKSNLDKISQSILTLESDLRNNPASWNNRDEINKLQELRRKFDNKISAYTLDNLDPNQNPEIIVNLSNRGLDEISKNGTEMDKQKIENSINAAKTRRAVRLHRLSAQDWKEVIRVDTKVSRLKKGNW